MRSLARGERGAVSVLVAGALTLILGCLALSVDMGSVFLANRRLQGIADAAALSAAANLSAPAAAATATVAANHWVAATTLTVTTGGYAPDPTIVPARRFDPAAATVDSVRVTIASEAPVFFATVFTGRATLPISRSATATQADLAAFSIGTRLAALDGGVANALLSALTGSRVSLSVMDYDALASGDVDLFAFSRALRTRSGLSGGGFATPLAGTVALPTALGALGDALDSGGQSGAATAVRQIAVAATSGTVSLDRLLDLGPYAARDDGRAGTARIAAWDLAQAMLALADGNRQVAVDLGASVPGLASTTVALAIGERSAQSPWLTITTAGTTIVRTAQTRLVVDAALTRSALGVVHLPVVVELAEAEAKLSAIDCAGGSARAGATILVRPSIGHASIAAVDPARLADFTSALVEQPGPIAQVGAVAVRGSARIAVGGTQWQTLAFTADDIAARRVKQVSTNDAVAGVVASLVGGINLGASIGPLAVSAPSVTGPVGVALTGVAPGLDAALDALTGLLGLHLGQADVRVNGVRCAQPALVG